MPKRTDIKSILILGSGPIIISQACEFDYSGSQACKALREEGYRVVLINSNPATIMTDPELADATYVEPLEPGFVARVIEKERPDALLPTLGGQTALNLTVELQRRGVLEKYGLECIGADVEAIMRGEDRRLFKEAMEAAGLELPRSGWAYTLEEARRIARSIGFPLVVRPSFTLGGTGGGLVYNRVEFEKVVAGGLELSANSEVLIEESVAGWKEFELEVMRDRMDNVVVVCSIENLDPMGVHTGDSITVAPVQTLSDRDYQRMRDAAIACIRAVGVSTGGSNIQFAVNPADGRMVVIEMNPRVSRSSALASKATGFPIARIAAKLAVGYTLDEIPNDITRMTPACFEPAIDYCVVKIPRFTFEKFPGADTTLGTAMKSVGETMAIGRNFREALGKAVRALETGRRGLGADSRELSPDAEALGRPGPERIYLVYEALRRSLLGVDEIGRRTGIDPWFLEQIKIMAEGEEEARRGLAAAAGGPPGEETARLVAKAKADGLSDACLARLAGKSEAQVRELRRRLRLAPAYNQVDTCAAEFAAATPYFYSTWNQDRPRAGSFAAAEGETAPGAAKGARRVLILGAGPNRIGQGIEFDYACVHASYALREAGCESVMVNCNPETVSTDYDTSSRLYFEPLTLEDVLEIAAREKPFGAIVQFGGQTPLNLALDLERNGLPILGTSPRSIDAAEDRRSFCALIEKLRLRQPPSDTVTTVAEALAAAGRIGYPVMVRPSYVLGGRAMEVVYDPGQLESYLETAAAAGPGRPVLVDRFLEDAVEVDVDAISDGETTVVAGIMEHIEEAGVHSGDSAMVLPPHSLSWRVIGQIRAATAALARELRVVGLMNIQFAVHEDRLYVLEVNPRSSRTVPFVSKAIGVPLARLATRVMLGEKLSALGFTAEIWPEYTAVKESVFPFNRFPGVDAVLGPEMRSTGEVMGIAPDFGPAFYKSQLAAGTRLPESGRVFISVRDRDKPAAALLARSFRELGFEILATAGTAAALAAAGGVTAEVVGKVSGERPNILDYIKNGTVQLVINTPSGFHPRRDTVSIRATAVARGVPLITTMAGAQAALGALVGLRRENPTVSSLQELHRRSGLRARPIP